MLRHGRRGGSRTALTVGFLSLTVLSPSLKWSSMPTTARIPIPDVPVHIPQRGNNRQDIFFVDSDNRVYLWGTKRILTLLLTHDLNFLALCPMEM
jgi:hypothetical protein